MKKILILLITYITLSQISSAKPDPNFHIYLCIGQSNMQGVNKPEKQDSIQNDRFLMMATSSVKSKRKLYKWYPATPPLAHHYNFLSPMISFGNEMAQLTNDNIQIGVIVVAAGSASIQLFDKDDYTNYLEKASDMEKLFAGLYDNNCYQRIIDCGKKAQKRGCIKGILFQQGESDVNDSLWISRVKKIYENIITDLNLSSDSVPFLVGETLQNGMFSSLNETIAKIPAFINNSHIISSEGLKGNDDNIHFTSSSCRELGKRYAHKMIEFLPDSIKKK
ncbi:MAG: sialate O-acetylesterase [Paludibacteraceae bacterium]|nr:sialate O-acetylesterase [Paludibacteraceae bacterium]